MLLIKNGRLIDPLSKKDEVVDIAIDGGKIKKIGKIEVNEKFKKIIDAKGYIVSPGLIDVHVHFRDPGFTYKEDILTGAKSAARGGFTTVVCMANTKPVVDNVKTLNYVNEKAKEACINVLQVGSITKSFRGKELTNFEELLENGAVGFSDDGIAIMDTEILYKAMNKAKELDVPISLHEEDSNFIETAGVNDSEIAKKLGLKGGAKTCAEDVMVARDCMIALETGAKVSIQHISSGVAVETVRFAKSLGAKVYAEAAPHHFTLTEEDVLKHGSLAKMNPPLRTHKDKQTIIEGLKDNTIEIIATDHAPHIIEEKSRAFAACPSGIIGLETSLALGITSLVKEKHLSLMGLLEKMTINPAKLYNLDRGFIKEGAIADILIFNPDEEWTVKDFDSKSSNSPFIGEKLFGKVKYTISEGKIVYTDK
ncbi:Dihydroorotase [Terrisporobacter petrolearius]|uniref:Dihydroorotase n=1 Tax=Terrisporobacter hibernicus TaxID=2813371 RepID=A0AAX2ZFD6_9FIRM|nr:dihydroorotase [Terrisporobacter hibernicus]UEL47105.1 dihydroorotase [Terrisporobacter hibernicus]